ncbi:MAG TPA: lipoyl(octanoyl) transferase LipB [Solirubrobacteraceae bacterium]|nr:lipoyl(octanoyl) transferase LipB [Solirubrobacteraceae bacterium]
MSHTLCPDSSLRPDLWVCHLGRVPYLNAVRAQERIRAARQTGELADTLLLLEHPPVYTLGRRAGAGELPLGEDFYRDRGIEVLDSDRGGRITYHGPGQLVGYPIMAIGDVGHFVRTMEAAIVGALADEGIAAHARPQDGPGYTGVWVGERKIASIGVHIQRGVSTHGFAVNVTTDLEPFKWVIACGLPGVSMTSLACELARRGAPDDTGPSRQLQCFRRRMAEHFCRVHGRRQRLVSERRLGIDRLLAHPPSAEPAPRRAPGAAGVAAGEATL